ncbi:putative proliferation-associated protein 2G4 [Apostichopus japonicus]|uniref:Putative proliferation-associated protein 2G4 n=1 Tax=Stichopus japonicus TaxID=307972 RepID=A0A2G8JXP3_STIJA|nr:putative proliferation-associated protein 2G4 [Apostichopus japonicus]
MADSGSEEELTISNDLVVTKYKMAGDMVNCILKEVHAAIAPGKKVLEICEFGDNRLLEETGKVYKNKDIKKGIAFPTCISINNCVCHFSPLRSDKEVEFKEGDLVKVDLGAHIDGFVAVCAYSFVVGASKDNKVKDRRADAILAAHNSAEAVLRKLKQEVENYDVTEVIQKVSESFECQPIQGMLSHQLKQHVINGEKSIIQNPTDEQRREHEKCSLEMNEVYAVDVLVSTGEGKSKEGDTRTTVFKKTDAKYNLKSKTSRVFYSDVSNRFTVMPFTLRGLKIGRARLGVVECVKHSLVEPYPVFYEKEGEFVAQFKFTVLLMPNGPLRITQAPVDVSGYESEKKIEDKDMLAAHKAAEAAEGKEAPQLVKADE